MLDIIHRYNAYYLILIPFIPTLAHCINTGNVLHGEQIFEASTAPNSTAAQKVYY